MIGRSLACALLVLAALTTAADDRNRPIRTRACAVVVIKKIETALPAAISRALSHDPKEGRAAGRIFSRRAPPTIFIAVHASQRPDFPGLKAEGDENGLAYWARYDPSDGSFAINHAALHENGDDERNLAGDSLRLERMAARIAPSIIHETSHLRDHERIASPLKQLETEIVAGYREAFYLLDSLPSSPERERLLRVARARKWSDAIERKWKDYRSRPPEEQRRLYGPLNGLTRRHNENLAALPQSAANASSLLRDFTQGNEAFERAITKRYPALPSIFDDDGLSRQAARLPAAAATLDSVIDTVSRRCGPGASASERRTCASLNMGSEYLASIRRQRDAITRMERDSRDPVVLERAHAHFKALIAALRAEADRRRAEQRRELTPFAFADERQSTDSRE